MLMPDSKSLLEDFLGQVCFSCGGWKASRLSFCRRCYGKLPRLAQIALYKRFCEGYEEAFAEAMDWLRAHPDRRHKR